MLTESGERLPSPLMSRCSPQVACLAGSLIAGVAGLAAALKWDTPLIALGCAAVFPAAGVACAGMRSRSQVVKIGVYAFTGWALCFALGPTTSQSAAGRAHRVAADPLHGKAWYLPCCLVSWLMASVGTAFASNSQFEPSRSAGVGPHEPS